MPLVLVWGKSFEIFNTSPTPLSHCVSHCDKRSWCCYHETICIDSPTPTPMIERENIFRMSKDYTELGTHCSLEATLASPRVHRSARSTRSTRSTGSSRSTGSNRLIKMIIREHNPCVICQRWPAQVSQNSHMFSFEIWQSILWTLILPLATSTLNISTSNVQTVLSKKA